MILEDFLRYVKIDTQSDDASESTPSSFKQYDLLNLLQKELHQLGVKSEIDEFGRLYAHVEGNNAYDSIGLCSHVDTALECSGYDVKPQIIHNYQGEDILLGISGLKLSTKDFPHLKKAIGKTLITTDGTTLLGADDKAGVAIIMDVVRNVLAMKQSERRPLSLLFTPDEEIGRGPEHFSLEKFNCKYAYTIDGSDPLHVSVENFNAESMDIAIHGKSIHPGSGKGKLYNAILLMNELIDLLPENMTPYKTEGREGFNHIVSMEGNVELARAHFILRNHDKEKLIEQVKDFERAKKVIEEKYPGSIVVLVHKEQYKNMGEVIFKNRDCMDTIENVFNKLDLKLEYTPTRGGTDGATFSFLGCPCPNLGTGSYNHHGRFEFAILEEMELMSKIVTEIFRL